MVDMVFPFIAAYINFAAGRIEEAQITALHTWSYDPINLLLCFRYNKERKLVEAIPINFKILMLQAVSCFRDLGGMNLLAHLFHTLDHTEEGLSQYGDTSTQNKSLFKQFN